MLFKHNKNNTMEDFQQLKHYYTLFVGHFNVFSLHIKHFVCLLLLKVKALIPSFNINYVLLFYY